MPNITEFDAGNLGLQPSEVGVSAAENAGRRIGAFGNQIAEDYNQIGSRVGSAVQAAGEVYVQHENFKEIGKLSADLVVKRDQLNQSWNDYAKTHANDPNAAAKFREAELDPALESFGSDAQTQAGQDFAQAHVAQLREEMFHRTAADMSTLAGIQARANVEKTVNALSNTTMNDPASLDHSLALADSTIGAIVGSAPNLSATDAARATSDETQKAKEKIVQAAAYGSIQKTGQMPSWASDPKYAPYINGMQLKQLEAVANTQQKSNALVAKQTLETDIRLADMKAHAASNKAFTDNVSIDPTTNQPVINPNYYKDALAIARDNPNAPQAATIAKTMMDWGEHQQKHEDSVSDPATRQQLLDGMLNDTKPVNAIDVLRAQADGKLSNKDAGLMKEILQQNVKGGLNDPLLKGVMDAAKGEILQSLDGHENYGKFFYAFVRDYQRQSAAGTLPPNALDLRDDNSLISQYFNQFKPSIAEKAQYHIFRNLGANPSDIDFSQITSNSKPAAPPTPTAAMPKVTTQAQYDALPIGATFIGTDGKTYRKPPPSEQPSAHAPVSK